VPNLGDTFLGGGEVHGANHLWIVLNDPAAHENRALIVNIGTLRPHAEQSCILQAGEHPFIRHDSYVRFASARAPKDGDLAKLITAGRLVLQQPASTALVEKIRAAAQASPMLASELKGLL
jgi:hypothetical protein